MYRKITIYLEDVEELPDHCAKCGLDCSIVCRKPQKPKHNEYTCEG